MKNTLSLGFDRMANGQPQQLEWTKFNLTQRNIQITQVLNYTKPTRMLCMHLNQTRSQKTRTENNRRRVWRVQPGNYVS